MQALSAGLYTKLTAVQTAGTVYALTGGRIYDTLAPHETGTGNSRSAPAFPYLVFSVISDPADRGFSYETQRAAVEFEIIGDKRGGKATLGTINEALFDLLNGSSITIADHDRGVVTCDDRGFPTIEEDAMVITSIYTVEATEFN